MSQQDDVCQPEDFKILTQGPRPCEKCPMPNGRKVGSRGDPKSPFVIIGEAPFTDDIRHGMPFSSSGGELLQKNLPVDFDFDRDAYVLNAMQCRPPKTDSVVKDKEYKARACAACRGRVLEQVFEHPRKAILALGNWASSSLTANYDFKITQKRGEVYTILSPQGDVIPVMPTLHPAFMMRGGGNPQMFRQDLHRAVELARGVLDEQREEWSDPQNAVLDSVEAIKQFYGYMINQVDKQGGALLYIASDIETGGFEWQSDRILCTGFYTHIDGDDTGYIVPEEWLQVEEYAAVIRQIYNEPKFRFIWHFGKFDQKFLLNRKLAPLGVVHEDTGLLSYAISEATKDHDLDEQAKNVLQAPNHKQALKRWVKSKSDSYANVPKHILYDYLAKDLKKTFKLWERNRQVVKADVHLDKLYTYTLIPATKLLTTVENRGIHVDWDYVRINRSGAIEDDVKRGLVKSLSEDIGLERELFQITEKLAEEAGYVVNPNSPDEVADLLYARLGLKIKNKTPKDTTKETLDKLPAHPCVKLIRTYRSVTKMLSTYVGAIEKRAVLDRIHTNFKLHITTTGRLSSSEPNIQNIPRNARFRRMYRARPGYVLIEADYNAAELRMLAVLSQDEFLMGIYLDAMRSLHDEVSVAMYGPDYTEDQRIRAKAINFGIPYGREAFSIAEEFGISTKEAQRLIDAWFARAPEAAAFIRRQRSAPLRGQTLVSVFGRKRRPGIVSADRAKGLQNEFANFHMQSPISDFTLHAGMEFTPKIERYGAGVVNFIHDSNLIECPDEPKLVRHVAEIVQRTMMEVPKRWITTPIEFIADLKVGTHWGQAQKWEKWLAATGQK